MKIFTYDLNSIQNTKYSGLLKAGLLGFCFLLLSTLVNAQTTYYSRATGNLNTTTNWTTSSNGVGGTSPGNFTTNNRIYIITNRSTATIGAAWTVSGTASKVVVGNGTAVNFTIPSGFAFTGTIDVAAQGTLTILNTTIPTFGTLNAAGTVEYGASGTQTITATTYGNLTVSGSGNANMAGAVTVSGDFNFNPTGGATFRQNNATANALTILGDMSMSGSGSYDFNAGNSGASVINLSGNFSNGSGVSMSTGGAVINGEINFAGTGTQTFSNAGTIQYVNYRIANTSTLVMSNNLSLSIDATAMYRGTMNVSGVLNTNGFLIGEDLASGSGTAVFNVASGGTFITSNATGMTGVFTGTNTTKTFNSGANYEFRGASTGTMPNATMNNLVINNGGTTTTATQALTINGGLTIGTNNVFTTASTLAGTLASTSGTGTLKVQNATPLPASKIWNFVVEYDGAAQNVAVGTYSGGLTLSNSGVKTAAGDITAGGVLTVNNNITFDFAVATYELLGTFTTAGTGTLFIASTAAAPLPTGITWTFDVNYDGATQTVSAGTYTNLSITGSNNKTASNDITVNGELNINSGRTFLFANAGYELLGTFTTTGTGTLSTISTAVAPISSGIDWSFTVIYAGTAAQNVVGGTYTNLSVSSTGTKTVTGDLDISGTLTITNAAAIFDLSTRLLSSVGTIANTGTIRTANTSASPIPTGRTWGGTIVYYAATQSVLPGTYNNLTISTAGTKTAIGDLAISGALTISASTILDMDTYVISSLGSTSGATGALRIGSLNSTPVPTGKTWAFSVNYDATANQTLMAGTYSSNLTISGSGTATPTGDVTLGGTLTVSAGCTIDMGTNRLIGPISSTSGTGKLLTANTHATLPIPTGDTWTFTVEFNGTAAQNLPAGSFAVLRINNTAGVTTVGAISSNNGVVLAGALLNIAGGTFTVINDVAAVDFEVFGKLRSSSAITTNGVLEIKNGGFYQHNYTTTAGTIPTATWAAGSTCEIIGYTAAVTPTGLGQNFSNFTWNCAGQGITFANLAGALLNVAGNFTMQAGNLYWRNTNSAPTITTAIGGDMIIQGGDFRWNQQNGGTYTINLAGNYNQTGGTFTNTIGTLAINFTGANKTYTNTGTITTTNINFNVNNAASLKLNSSLAIATTRAFTVLSGGSVEFDASAFISGAGSFVLSSGGNIVTANAAGINSSGATGSVQSTTRTFNTVADYDFRGAATGTFTTTPTASTIRNLTVNSSGTALSQNLTVTGAYNLTNGALNVGTNTLILNGAVTITGGSLTSAATGTVNYNQSSAGQNVAAGSYGNLTFSNQNKILPADVVKIAGTFTPGTATGHTITNNTIEFTGAGAQTIPVFLYNNFSASGAGVGAKTFAAGTAKIAGNWSTTGSKVDPTPATIEFNGTGPQSIQDAGTDGGNGVTFRNVNFTGGSTKTLSATGAGRFSIAAGTSFGVLNVTGSSTLETGGLLTLRSDASGFGQIGNLTAGTVSGDVNVEMFFAGGNRTTRMLGSPVNDAATVNTFYENLKDAILITGPAGSTGGFDVGTGIAPNALTIQTYNEPALMTQSQFTPLASMVNSIRFSSYPGTGSGIMLFYRGDRTNPANKFSAPFTTPESTVATFKGPINSGDITVNLVFTNNPGDDYNGYNVVSNPYPATIDLSQIVRSSDVPAMFRILKPAGGMITWLNGIVVTSGPLAEYGDPNSSTANYPRIQPGQAFYVKANSTGQSVTFKESHKSTALPAVRLLTAPIKDKLLQVLPGITNAVFSEPKFIKFNLKNSTHIDETAIIFGSGYSAAYDGDDAIYFSGTTVSLSTLSSDNIALAINYMPDIAEVPQVRINFNATASGLVSLNFTNLTDLGTYKITLKDNYLNTLTDVKANPTYNFDVDRSIAATFGAGRFVLLFEAGPVPLEIDLSAFTAAQINNSVSLNWVTATERSSVKFEVERSADGINFTKIGEVAGAGESTSALPYAFTDNSPLNGTNNYRLKQIYTDGSSSYSTIKTVTYTAPVVNVPKQNLKIYPNPTSDFVNIKITGVRSQLNIYDLFGRKVKTASYALNENIRMDVSGLFFGIYCAEVKDLNTGKVIDRMLFIKKW